MRPQDPNMIIATKAAERLISEGVFKPSSKDDIINAIANGKVTEKLIFQWLPEQLENALGDSHDA